MNWGKWLFVSFVLFALFIGTLVTVCINQDMPLVASDYYQQELDYQQRINQTANTAGLASPPKIEIQHRQLTISFGALPQMQNGQLKLFRPSNALWDKTYAIPVTDQTSYSIDVSTQMLGQYKAQLTWQWNGKEYFTEETVYLN